MRTDRTWLWLKQAWIDELPTALHSAHRGKGVGDLRGDVYRVLTDKYIQWSPAIDANDRLYWFPEHWLMPAHEGVKRIKKNPEQRWLRSALSHQGAPEDALRAISEIENRPVSEIEGALLRLARLVARTVGLERDQTVPV